MFAKGIDAGQRVRVLKDIERFPHGICRAGETGTVDVVDRRNNVVSIEMDNRIDWLALWDNCLIWYNEDEFDGTKFLDYFEIIA